MSNIRLAYLLYWIPLFVTIALLVVPVQTRAQPTSAEDNSCFPVEPGAVTLMCTEGPASASQEANSTSSASKGSSSSISSDNSCFPVEPGAVTLMCTEGPASAGQEANSTSIED